ncbi:aspartate--tRNA ligase [Candidatus Acetothermia bacterium]|nr:MAG: aspartate--tRNA ligase [Candidatus Acetothermia bacterium]
MRREACGSLRGKDVGRKVTLAGWVHRLRDLGGLTFVDLRDESGIVQLVFRELPDAHGLSREDVIRIQGTVALREAPNPDLPTGEVEVEVEHLEILSQTQPLPFPVDEEPPRASEETRLRYRYLDLRRPRMQRNLRLRHRTTMAIRAYLDRQDFIEVETPMLTRSTPEGARDFLVPSRLEPGKFYALPQSPQLFKQILVCSGVERYFQIVRCFRDEDLRADRQPEFTQLDLEMAFLEDPEELFSLIEGLLAHVFRETIEVELEVPFPRLPYEEAISRYGSDKPDLRFGLELSDVTELFSESEMRVLREAVAKGGRVFALRVPGGADFSRKELGELEEVAKTYKAKGLLWLARGEELRGPLAKFLPDPEPLWRATEAQPGDLLLFVADAFELAATALGQVRLELGRKLSLIPEGKWCPLWVVDFPLLEWSEEENRWNARHHPFTSPRADDLPKLMDPSFPSERLGELRANAYDLVLNGVELGGGSIRIHRREVQQRMLEVLGIGPEEAERRFGFFLRALEYGAPPHGGIALGLDRWVMMLAGEESLREVIAFPKTASGACPLTGAPAEVDPRQLAELHLQVKRG